MDGASVARSGALQSEPSLVGYGCCWDRAVTSGVDIGADDAARASARSSRTRTDRLAAHPRTPARCGILRPDRGVAREGTVLAPKTRAAIRIGALLYIALGVVLFAAPEWSASVFPWSVSPLVAMTIGGW